MFHFIVYAIISDSNLINYLSFVVLKIDLQYLLSFIISYHYQMTYDHKALGHLRRLKENRKFSSTSEVNAFEVLEKDMVWYGYFHIYSSSID